MKKSTLVLILALMTTTTAHSAPDVAGQMVNPNAQYTYAETDECLTSIRTLSLTSSDVDPTIGLAMIAMLGRLPACEIEKIILAGGNERAISFINKRKLDIKKNGQ